MNLLILILFLAEEVPVQIPMMKSPLDKIQLTPGQALPPGFPGPFIFADSLSSVETLLTNIQGLLKVALDNAHIQEKQIQQEKKELRMELYRERGIRENLERQLAVELQSRSKFNKFNITTMQKRLKKEKKAKRKLQEALEFESKRREQVEQALKQATTSDSGLRMLKDTGIPDIEIENSGTPHDSTAMQGSVCVSKANLDGTQCLSNQYTTVKHINKAPLVVVATIDLRSGKHDLLNVILFRAK
ncbi:hypothetical protein E2I00_006687 [Balaenoptera physalus]|uniref:Uncharacterized protein n=1 Tax=Balaenoptera physalus TaxID=9770 RepID=A0A643BLI9_BALPH|nr:hypothetical protein E2I00_006687 [Balaenoptera physalus]